MDLITYQYIANNDDIFRNNLIKNYKNISNFINKIKNKQIGGGKKIKIKYNDEKFVWEEDEPNQWFLRDVNNDYDCVSVSFDSETKTAGILNINSDIVKCGNTILTNQGSHLFRITLKFIKKYKDTFGINKIQLKDTSIKYCNQNVSIKLGHFLTLLNGETWYTKYGFRPINNLSKESYEYNKQIMNTTNINQINFSKVIKLLNKLYQNKKITREQLEYIIKIYDKYLPKNIFVKHLLRLIFRPTKYNFICNVFNLIYDDLVQILKLKTGYLANENYYLEI